MNYIQPANFYQNPNDQIRKHSFKSFNENIDEKTDSIIQLVIAEGPISIGERLNELDKEWDIDKAVLLFQSGLIMIQLANAMKKQSKNSLWGPLIQTPLLMLHATFGWSPVTMVFRKLGFRTRFEIQAEREVLLNFLEQENYGENLSATEWDVFESI
jgi:hypothetical protein